jgi:murein L,D-transpeptidase YafK
LNHARRGAERIGARAARYVDEGHVRQWCTWQESTVRWSRRHRAAAIVVNKEQNSLTLYVDGKLERTFHADIGQTQLEAKLRAEDGATPEGRYRITRKKGRRLSTYHKALELSYPNEDDRRRHREAVRTGRVSSAVGAGNLIEIHGHGGRGRDWTRGCVALADRDVDYVFDAVVVGTPVTIIGGDGRGGRFSSLAARLIAAQRSIDAYAKH